MNIKQMKAAINQFRAADVSAIKDAKLRAKAHKLQNKEKGFTLLELLVVITLIAILATGALIAYEGVGESAESAQAGNTLATLDRAIRTYRAVENVYPNQWDALLDETGAELTFTSPAMRTFLGAWTPPDVDAETALKAMFAKSGLAEIQEVTAAADLDDSPTGAPNRMHNESAGLSEEVEIVEDDELMTALAVVPSAACAAEGSYPADTFSGITIEENALQNSFGDALESDECHALIALGFGGDAAASSAFSNVAIAQSPTYQRTTGVFQTSVNPEVHYSRYIGLFQAGQYDIDDAEWNWNDRLRLIALVSTDGKNIDQLVSESQQATPLELEEDDDDDDDGEG